MHYFNIFTLLQRTTPFALVQIHFTYAPADCTLMLQRTALLYFSALHKFTMPIRPGLRSCSGLIKRVSWNDAGMEVEYQNRCNRPPLSLLP